MSASHQAKDHPGDGELVRRCQRGQTAAFDALVRRHRGDVLLWAQAQTGDPDAAEDLSQEVFIEAFRSLPTLRDAERFQPWLHTIARRVAARWFAGQQRERQVRAAVEQVDDGWLYDPAPSPEEACLLNELRETVRRAIRALSDPLRQVTILYYLEDHTCEEIGRRLQIPVGTVKRRLFQARDRLRKEMKVMATPEPTLSAPPRELQIVIWGSHDSSRPGDPFRLGRPLLHQRILLALADQSRSIPEIAQIVRAHEDYVCDALSPLVENEMVRAVGPQQYRAHCFLLRRREQAALRKEQEALGQRAAAVLAEEMPSVQQALADCSFFGQGFDWDWMQWIVVAVYLANLGVRASQPEVYAITPPLRPCGLRHYVFGVEVGEAPQGEAGCNSTTWEGGGSGHFWTPQVRQASTGPLSREYEPLVAALITGSQTRRKLAATTGLDEATLDERLSRLLEGGYARKEGRKLALTFPVFPESDLRRVEAEAKRVGQRIVQEVDQPAYPQWDAIFDDLGYGHLREQYEGLRAFVASDCRGAALGALVERGVLPPSPSEAPARWGLWCWLGRSDFLGP